MKKMKILGLIAIIAIIGLGMVACGDDCIDHDWDWDIAMETGATATQLGKQDGTCKVCDATTTRNVPGVALIGTYTLVGTATQTAIITYGDILITNSATSSQFDYKITDWQKQITGGTTDFTNGYRLVGKATSTSGSFDADKNETALILYYNETGSSFRIKWSSEADLGGTYN